MGRFGTCVSPVLLVGLAILFSGPLLDLCSSHADAQTTWTFMVYMANDNVSQLPWDTDLNEMEAGAPTDDVTILALVDLLGPHNTTLYKVERDPGGMNTDIVSTVLDDEGTIMTSGEADMASSATLDAFVRFSLERYPAQNTVLVLWGHGAGWYGMCPDGFDLLTLPELRSALQSAASSTGVTLGMIVVDACSEGSMEMLAQLDGCCDYFVASEKDVPYQGLPYTSVLNGLAQDTGQSLEDLGEHIVDAYVEWSWYYSQYSVTSAVFDMGEVGGMIENVSAFSYWAMRYDGLFHDVFANAVSSAQTYEEAWCTDFADLMAKILLADLPLEIRRLALDSVFAYDNLVVYFNKYDHIDPVDDVHVDNASGAAIYFPDDGPEDLGYFDLELASTCWDDFARLVRNTTEPNEPLGDLTATYSDSIVDDDALYDTVTLDWSLDDVSTCAWIFEDKSDGLSFLGFVDSNSSEITITGFYGELVVSCSAHKDGVAVSYEVIDVMLRGQVAFEITLDGCDRIDSDRLNVTLTSDHSTMEFEAGIPDDGSPTTSISVVLTIPDDARVGDFFVIEVTDLKTGAFVGRGSVMVNMTPSDVTIVLSGEPKETPNIVPWLFALLPGALILLFDAIVYLDYRRTRKGN